jgi:hypothetical protein
MSDGTEADDCTWRDCSIKSGNVGWEIGRWPGRKSLYLSRQEGARVDLIAIVRSEQDADTLWAFLAHLLAGRGRLA